MYDFIFVIIESQLDLGASGLWFLLLFSCSYISLVEGTFCSSKVVVDLRKKLFKKQH